MAPPQLEELPEKVLLEMDAGVPAKSSAEPDREWT